jgi:hypothetical protein
LGIHQAALIYKITVNVLLEYKNLLKAESPPFAKPDWCGVIPVSNCE